MDKLAWLAENVPIPGYFTSSENYSLIGRGSSIKCGKQQMLIRVHERFVTYLVGRSYPHIRGSCQHGPSQAPRARALSQESCDIGPKMPVGTCVAPVP